MGFWSKPKDIEVEAVPVEPVAQPEETVPNLPTPPSKTVIATGLTVSGRLEGEGVIQVQGVIKGEIVLKGAVIVDSTGSIQGPVTADVIQIAGNVQGNCVAREHMRLEKTGSLEGDVTTISLIVHDGGRLNGRSNMVQEVDAKTRAAHQKPAAAGGGEELQFGPNYKVEDEKQQEEHKDRRGHKK